MNYPKRTQYKYAKTPYRVRNWPEYEMGVRQRGDLTVRAIFSLGSAGLGVRGRAVENGW